MVIASLGAELRRLILSSSQDVCVDSEFDQPEELAGQEAVVPAGKVAGLVDLVHEVFVVQQVLDDQMVLHVDGSVVEDPHQCAEVDDEELFESLVFGQGLEWIFLRKDHGLCHLNAKQGAFFDD